MNDTIIKYAKEAGLGTLGVKGDFIFFQPGTKGLQKFTELIVKEVFDTIENERFEVYNPVIQKVKNHFGVEE